MKSKLLKYHKNELVALLLFFVGGTLGMLGLIQKVPLVLGILGIVILASGLFYFCLSYSSEKVYKEYYKDSYEIEHETIEDEIRGAERLAPSAFDGREKQGRRGAESHRRRSYLKQISHFLLNSLYSIKYQKSKCHGPAL